MPEMAWHAMCSSWEQAVEFCAGLQMRAQYFLPDEASWSAHCGLAVTPDGTSLGHGEKSEHLGVQKSPETPEIVTSTSSVRQPPLGSS